jgi:bacillithiol synthase
LAIPYFASTNYHMIGLHKIPLEQTHAFSKLLHEYLAPATVLKPFHQYAPSIEGIRQAVAECHFPVERRAVLKSVLQQQYDSSTPHALIQQQLEHIDDPHTFFVTTGQQIHVLGGPLYVLFKIASTIKLAEECKRAMPDKHFIPLFWMASEDHDLAEIDHVSVFGKVYHVDLQATGPAGRVSNRPINAWISSVPDVPPVFKEAYATHDNLSLATRHWLHELFSAYGLLILDADEAALKKEFIPIIEQELFAGLSVGPVRECTQRLEDLGYKGQVYPRDINLFYISDQGRHRIEFKNNTYEVQGTGVIIDPYRLKEEVHQHPERFSPNVALRPIYQQYILPNVAYVGGPAEVAYWLQLKTLFDKLEMKMPVIMPRNFGMILTKNIMMRLKKLDLAYADLFLSEEALKQLFFEKKNYALPAWEDSYRLLNELWKGVEDKALKADGSLQGYVAAEKSKLEKQLEGIEKRVQKSYEQKLDQELSQLTKVKEQLFPEGSLQERKESFVSFMVNDPTFIPSVIALVNPFDFKFHVFTDED